MALSTQEIIRREGENKRIEDLRKNNGINQTEISRIVGHYRDSYWPAAQKARAGKRLPATISDHERVRLASYFNISVEELKYGYTDVAIGNLIDAARGISKLV